MDDRVTLQLITAPQAGGFSVLVEKVERALTGGVRWVQLRDKTVTARELAEQAHLLRTLCRAHGAGLAINDRLDLALAVGADGVHLGEDDLPWSDARRLAPPPFVIGVSVDRVTLLTQAEAAKADYVGVGPAFPTRTKQDAGASPPHSLYRELTTARSRAALQIIAVGGIEPGRVAPLVAAGVDGIAVSAGLLGGDPRRAAQLLRTELDAARNAQARATP